MKKQKIFTVEWAGFIENDYRFDWIVANSISDAEAKARLTFHGLTNIRSISDNHHEIYA